MKISTSIYTLALISITFAFIMPVNTQAEEVPEKASGMKGNMPSFADFDQDNDGIITEMELNEGRSKRMAEMMQKGGQMKNVANMPSFADLDINGDGGISADEFAAHQASHRKNMAEKMKQGPKMKNRTKMSSFDDIDTNGDGYISRDEFTAHHAEKRQQKEK